MTAKHPVLPFTNKNTGAAEKNSVNSKPLTFNSDEKQHHNRSWMHLYNPHLTNSVVIGLIPAVTGDPSVQCCTDGTLQDSLVMKHTACASILTVRILTGMKLTIKCVWRSFVLRKDSTFIEWLITSEKFWLVGRGFKLVLRKALGLRNHTNSRNLFLWCNFVQSPQFWPIALSPSISFHQLQTQ